MNLKIAPAHFLRKTMAMALAFAISAPAFAPAATPVNLEPVAKKGESYLSPCADLFQDLRGEKKIEEVFLSQVKTQEQMRQLLYDYNLLFTQSFYNAVLFALDKRGVMIEAPIQIVEDPYSESDPPLISKKNLKDMKTFILRLRDLAQDREQLRSFTWEVVNHLVSSSHNASDSAMPTRDRVLWEQKRNLVETVQSSPQKPVFEAEMMELVEQVLLSTVVQMTRNWAQHRGLRHQRYGNIVAFTGGMLISKVSLVAIAHALSHSEELSRGHQFATTVGGVLGGFVSWFLNYAIGSNAPGTALVQAYSRIRGGELRPLDFTPAHYRSFPNSKPTVAALWESVDENAFASKSALSIEEACKTNFCEMTPVQLAYAGHIDFLELKLLQEQLNAAFSGDKGMEPAFNELGERARRLEDQSSSYTAQAEFLKNFRQIVQQLQAFHAGMELHRSTIQKRSDELAAFLEKLREQSYSQVTAEIRPDEIAKGELLVARLETDLATLESFKINGQALDKKAARLLAATTQLETLSKAFPKSRNSEDWKRVAQDILILLDQIRASQIGSSK